MRIAIAFTVVAALCAPRAYAQAPAPVAVPAQPAEAQAQPAKPSEAPQAAPAPPPAETYSYRADGRRDPFQSLLHAGADIVPHPGREQMAEPVLCHLAQ